MTGIASPPGRRRGAGARQRTTVALGATLSVLLTACGADSTDFRISAEKFIEGDTMAQQARTTFSRASCASPESTEPGTTFGCEAVDATGTAWAFEVVIVNEENFEIAGRAVG